MISDYDKLTLNELVPKINAHAKEMKDLFDKLIKDAGEDSDNVTVPTEDLMNASIILNFQIEMTEILHERASTTEYHLRNLVEKFKK